MGLLPEPKFLQLLHVLFQIFKFFLKGIYLYLLLGYGNTLKLVFYYYIDLVE